MSARVASLILVLLGVGTAACDQKDPTGIDQPVTQTAGEGVSHPLASAAQAPQPHIVKASTTTRTGQWKQHTVSCPTGERSTGGGYLFDNDFYLTSLMVSRNQPLGSQGVPTGWIVKLRPTGIDNATLTVFAVCMPS